MFGHLYSKQQTTEPRGAPFAAGVITTRCRDKAKAKAGLRSDPAGIFSPRIWRSWSRLTAVRQALVHSGRPSVRRLPSHSSLRSIMDHSVGASKPEHGRLASVSVSLPNPVCARRLAPPIRSGFGRDCDSMMDEHRSVGRSMERSRLRLRAAVAASTCWVSPHSSRQSIMKHSSSPAGNGNKPSFPGKNRRLFFWARVHLSIHL